jgi:chromosome partitioning protein
MLFAFANPKGGVGKSTLSVHATVWLAEKGSRVALVDADVQSSSTLWLKEVSPDIPLFRLLTPDDVLDQLPRIQSEHEHVIVDGPAGLSEVTRAILLLADVAFLPCGPSVLDLWAASGAINVLRQVQRIRKGPPKAVLVPNKIKTRHRLSKEFLETARSMDIPASPGVRDLQAYADSVGQGTVVWRMGPRTLDAGIEIQQLFMELFHDVCSTKALDERRIKNG